MLLFLGMAAMGVDYGLGVNERRADQTAADLAVTAGAVDSLNGADAVRDSALSYARLNLPTTYTAADWQAMWESCVDPAAERNSGGANFIPLTPPAGWTVVDPANWCISAEGARGLLRVRVPDQTVQAAFGGLVGVNELTLRAAAVSRVQTGGHGGILPFGLPAGLGDGGHVCLSSGPTGQAEGPCEGSESGNFGTLKGAIYGNTEMGTTGCRTSPVPNVLAENIAHGYDHLVVLYKGAEVRDQCFEPYVNTLNTDTGFPNDGAEDGLVGGTKLDPAFTPRFALNAGPGGHTTAFGYTVEDTPLWSYLLSGADYSGSVLGAPVPCDPDGFDGGTFDWDGDGIDDNNQSWQHMKACIDEYVSGGHTGVIFSSGLGDNAARFGYIPEFVQANLGSGNSWLNIKRFRAVYLQTTTWKKGGNYVFANPGEACVPGPCAGNGYSMRQLTAFVIPDNALPEEVKGDPMPGAVGINPLRVELFG